MTIHSVLHVSLWSMQSLNLVLARYVRSYYRQSVIAVFTVRRYALHGLCDRNSVCPSVRLSVCLFVTHVDCVNTVGPTIMIY